MDWNRIKAEYIAGGTSYRKLAEKHKVSFSTLRKVAAKEHWADLRNKAGAKADTKMVNDVSTKNAKIDDTYFRCVDKLMKKAEELIENTSIWQPTMLKDMATTMKYLKECKGVKSDADMREQEARIKKLEMEAAFREEDDDKPSGVVLMPAVSEELKPPIKEESNG